MPHTQYEVPPIPEIIPHTIWPSWNNGSEPLSQDKQHGHAVSFPHMPLTAPNA